ncbi:16S rRNA (cytosine(967)-C(5))-methyltransferase RsmB [Gimesia panareensis]|uniref:Ribosomal RNA small subunit methyltransferase B n=1 Tax=Gimesia panareensis TaxID=2527978 RepID=A0A517QBD1_9PLAN|nr:16S rRNA (cytosine(967)-C(5))-methyltransferase RsmB [Gimesia panareensis]QDT28926.1 Ribosomal RNA small subunit methyltransferase B [Gimesia panareensis]QDU51772.1 Ribosomal RNA small subunit methyltransferase B [Gimesia panareensis]
MWSDVVKKKNVWENRSQSSPGDELELPKYFRTARQLAFFLLEAYRTQDQFVADSLQQWSRRIELSSQDRRLAMEISIGVIRRQLTLDTLIASQLTRPREKVEPALWTLLQTGVYQLVMLDQIPDHAAVSETVELAGKVGRERWKKLVNAILRAVSRLQTTDEASVPQANAVPLSEQRFRCLTTDLFPDPTVDQAGYLSRAYSYPRSVIEDWLSRYEWERLLSIAQWFNQRNPLYLRANLLQNSRDELLQELQSAGIAVGPGAEPQSIRLETAVPLDALVGFDAGKFTIQDESAMAAGNLLSPQPEEMVWDLCAAPGTKTTHLAELMFNRGTIIATDVSADRLDKIEQNASRLGLTCIQTQLINTPGATLPEQQFDAILVDAPCSNSGVLGKRPEARWRLDNTSLAELQKIQRGLLETAFQRLKPEGRLVYSTCSFDPRENGELLQSVLTQFPERKIVQENHHLPGEPSDGGYQALVR